MANSPIANADAQISLSEKAGVDFGMSTVVLVASSPNPDLTLVHRLKLAVALDEKAILPGVGGLVTLERVPKEAFDTLEYWLDAAREFSSSSVLSTRYCRTCNLVHRDPW